MLCEGTLSGTSDNWAQLSQMWSVSRSMKREGGGREREKWQRKQRSEEEDRKIKAGELRESKSFTMREFREDPGSGEKDKAFLHQHLK